MSFGKLNTGRDDEFELSSFAVNLRRELWISFMKYRSAVVITSETEAEFSFQFQFKDLKDLSYYYFCNTDLDSGDIRISTLNQLRALIAYRSFQDADSSVNLDHDFPPWPELIPLPLCRPTAQVEVDSKEECINFFLRHTITDTSDSAEIRKRLISEMSGIDIPFEEFSRVLRLLFSKVPVSSFIKGGALFECRTLLENLTTSRGFNGPDSMRLVPKSEQYRTQ